MSYMKLSWIVFVLAGMCSAQAQDKGLLPQWEIVELSEQLVENTRGVKTILDQVRPKEWLQDGAPQAYVDQMQSLESDLSNLSLSAQALARNPEKLSTVVETFLWLDRFNSILGSMTAGVRKYQNAALADLLDAATAKNNAGVGKLKEYLQQLAVEQEAEMEIAHSEAQRCRSILSKQPRKPAN